MPYDDAGKNTMLDALGAVIDAVGIHTGDPGTGATNEVSGGGYSRQSPSFASASGGAMALSADLNFSGPASADALWFTVWASGVRQGKGQITTGDQAFNAAGEYTLTTGTVLNLNGA